MTSHRPVLPVLSMLFWPSVGALGAFGVAGLATIGMFLLPGAVLVAAVGLAVPSLRPPSVPGLLVGLSTAPFYIGWLNRGGPGPVCTTTADSVACSDQWSPWPFVALGVLLAGAGIALLAATRRRDAGRPSTVSTDSAGSTSRT